MINIASTLPLFPESREQENVDFLKERRLTPDFLYKEKILPEGADIDAFVDDMRDVEGRASEMDVKLQWVGENNRAMAYVDPSESDGTIFFNLRTLVFDSHHRGTLGHEFKHLKQQWVTGNAYTPPGLDSLSDVSRIKLYKKAGMVNMSVRDVLEGFVEGSTAVKYGNNNNVSYTHFQVPEIKKLNAFVLEKTGVSLIACYVQMTAESMSKFSTALQQASNEVMLEESSEKIRGKSLMTEQKNHIKNMARFIFERGEVIENEEEAGYVVLSTRVPDSYILQGSISERVSHIQESLKYTFGISDFTEQNAGINIFGDVIYVTADKVVHILDHKEDIKVSDEYSLAA